MLIGVLGIGADATLSLVRAVTVAIVDGEPVAVPLQPQIASFAKVLEASAGTPQPWPEAVLREAVGTAHDALTRLTAEDVNRSPAPPAARRGPSPRADRGGGGRGGREPRRILGAARQAHHPPGRAHSIRPRALRRGTRARRQALLAAAAAS